MEVSKVEVVVLGLLAEEPMHGYELLERMNDRGMSHWAEVARASVYQAMRRLEDEGSITSKLEDGTEGPDRRVYRIARSGRDRLRRGVAERLRTGGEEAPTALGFVHHLSGAQARAGLAAHEAALKQQLSDVEARRTPGSADRGSGRTTASRMLERQASLIAADLAWLAQFRRGVGRLTK
jgi:DNA-binding PadR family transcriptional regulator